MLCELKQSCSCQGKFTKKKKKSPLSRGLIYSWMVELSKLICFDTPMQLYI